MMNPSVSVDRELLDRAARAADRVVRDVMDARERLAMGDGAGAAGLLAAADVNAQSAYLTLLSAGSHVPDAPRPLPVPIHLLDTPAARDLLAALHRAEELAGIVDAERGWVLPDGRPCGLAEVVGDVRERLRQQVEGPRGLEGR